MSKKIIGIGAATAIVIIAVAAAALAMSDFDFTDNSASENLEEPEILVEPDIIMPVKVSRPGCERDDRCYIPSVITIDSGNSVTWLNDDSAFHSVTSGLYEARTDMFDSGFMDPTQLYTVDFDEPGTYDYFCTLHAWMKGQVIVR